MTCQHHWLIAEPTGPTSPGRCRKCGATREFRNASDSMWEDSQSISWNNRDWRPIREARGRTPVMCPRCGSRLIRTHDEGVCLVHGTIITPVRAWDLPSTVDIKARRGNRYASPEWTEEERGWWREAGDPLPPEPAKVGRPPQAVCMRGHVKNTATMDSGGRCAVCRQMMEKARRERNKEAR